MENAIETNSLTKTFSGTLAVRDLTLAIPPGVIYGLVGANGAGKSTVLRLLLGLIWPTRGEVRLFGEPLPREAARFRQRVHYVGADGEVYKSFRVGDLIRYAKYTYERWDERRCDRLLDALELSTHQHIRQLSMGMKIQLRLAVALATRPDILLLDEPTTGLDPVVRRQFLQLLVNEVAQSGTTIVMATHQLDTLERIADGIAVLYRGRLVANGFLDDLKQSIRCYQMVVSDNDTLGSLNKLLIGSNILHQEHRGSVWTLVVEDADGKIGAALHTVVTHVEQLPLDLESLFSHLLQKEGYSREAILHT